MILICMNHMIYFFQSPNIPYSPGIYVTLNIPFYIRTGLHINKIEKNPTYPFRECARYSVRHPNVSYFFNPRRGQFVPRVVKTSRGDVTWYEVKDREVHK